MLASTCSIRFFSLALVKFLSRAFTALNLLPSIAATAWLNRSSRRHRSMNRRQVARIAAPLSFLKSAMVLKSGARPRQPHQLDVALALPLQPTARGDLVDVAINVDLQQHTRVIRRPSGRLRHDAREPQRPKVQLLNEHVDHPNRVLFRHIIIQIFRKQDGPPAVLTLDEALHIKLRSSVVEILTHERVFTQPRPLAD